MAGEAQNNVWPLPKFYFSVNIDSTTISPCMDFRSDTLHFTGQAFTKFQAMSGFASGSSKVTVIFFVTIGADKSEPTVCVHQVAN